MVIRLLGIGIGALACTACYPANPPVASSRSNNATIEVQTLFTHQGCTVYRFVDAGYHYYVRCDSPHAELATMSHDNCGRNCRRDETIQTVTPEGSASPPTEPPR